MPLLIDPYISFDLIDREELNRCLVAWDHKMGPLNRPIFKSPTDYVLRLHGEPLAVIAADTLIRPTCGFDRSCAFELSRMCAAPEHPRVSALMMRMWRAFGYTQIAKAWGTPWVISYQDAVAHTGNLYRYDSWLLIGYGKSGKDPRALPETASVRFKKIWGWNASAAAMKRQAKIEIAKPGWVERIAA